ncbi:MAG TPA: hypothetical protein PKI93_02925 [Alphaproteobacteria bacterium]|nr:hypothetical protein [Alphaproteobacteria bacterium]HNS45107.1 hypothetical protein [Alphaproteobacteria bacterium]
MTSQPNPINDPFDLLDTDAKVVPILSKTRLDEMIDQALTREQVMHPQRQSSWMSGKVWWSGGLATAACLILLLTLFPQNTVKQFATPVSIQTEQASSFSDDANDISEMMFYDSLEGF